MLLHTLSFRPQCDWLMPLFTVRKLVKINLVPEQNYAAFSPRNIHVQCASTLLFFSSTEKQQFEKMYWRSNESHEINAPVKTLRHVWAAKNVLLYVFLWMWVTVPVGCHIWTRSCCCCVMVRRSCRTWWCCAPPSPCPCRGEHMTIRVLPWRKEREGEREEERNRERMNEQTNSQKQTKQKT